MVVPHPRVGSDALGLHLDLDVQVLGYSPAINSGPVELREPSTHLGQHVPGDELEPGVDLSKVHVPAGGSFVRSII